MGHVRKQGVEHGQARFHAHFPHPQTGRGQPDYPLRSADRVGALRLRGSVRVTPDKAGSHNDQPHFHAPLLRSQTGLGQPDYTLHRSRNVVVGFSLPSCDVNVRLNSPACGTVTTLLPRTQLPNFPDFHLCP